MQSTAVNYDHYDDALYFLYFVGRFLVVLTSYFLCVVGVLYAIGSVVTLEATNFFCPIYTEEAVRQHNYENNNPHGEFVESCWLIDQQALNLNEIRALNVNIFDASIDTTNIINMIQSILYIIVTFILLISTIYQTYFLVYDAICAIISIVTNNYVNERIHKTLVKLKRKHVQSQNKKENQQNVNTNANQSQNQYDYLCCLCNCYKQCVRQCFECYFKYIVPVYYADSKLRTLSLVFREWFEIGIQFYALLLYGGINLLNLNENILSQEPYIIEAFTIIVATNCIIGVLQKKKIKSIQICFFVTFLFA